MPTRQIGWNVSEIAFAVMYVLVAVQALVLGYAFTRRVLMWRSGRSFKPVDRIGERVRRALAVVFLHRRLIRPGYVYAGLMHLFIFWGFVVLFIGTLIVLLEADIVRPYFGVSFYQGTFYVAYKLVINFFGLLFLIGLLMAVYRRYGQKLPKFRRNLSDDAIVLGILLFLGITGFLLEALRLSATRDPAAPIHWVAYPLTLLLNGVDPAVLGGVHGVTWWSHMLATTALLVYIPVSKLAHIFTGPANVFFRATDPRAALPLIANIEEQEHFGVAKLDDFSWKQLLNFDACMRCGRCLDFCPTFNTGKPLKPRQLIVEIGAYMNRQAGLLAGPAGPRFDEAGVRGNDRVSTREPTLAQVPLMTDLIGDIVSEDELWDCTTCRACMEQCPVSIEHVPLIVEMRRSLVLEQSKFPQELVTLFNNLERNSNPYSFPASSRADWAASAGVQELAQVEDPSSLEIIYWVGCMSSFDARNQRVATALARIFTAPVPDPGADQYRPPQPVSAEAHRRQLPALLQHTQERIPAAGRHLRRRPSQPVHPGAHRRGPTCGRSWHAGEAGHGLPRPVLPRALQRGVRRAARCSEQGFGWFRRAPPLSGPRLLLRRGRGTRLHGRKARHAHQPQPPERSDRHRCQRGRRGLSVLRDHVRRWGSGLERRGAVRGARYCRDRGGRAPDG